MWPFRRPDSLKMLGLSTEDICSHIFAIGASGSGKTSLLKILMEDIIRRDVSVLWACVKADESENAIRVIKKAGKEHKLKHLVPGKFTFNFLYFELTRTGGTPATATQLFQRLNNLITKSSGRKEEAYWANLFEKMMTYAITLCHMAKKNGSPISVEDVYQFIVTSPSSFEQVGTKLFKSSFCYQVLSAAERNLQTDSERRQYTQAASFILEQIISIGSKGRGSVLTQCSSVLSPFLVDPLYSTVCSETSNFTPEMPLDGYCVVMDFPVLVYQQGGILFQSLIMLMVMEAALRRKNPKQITALVRDECQYLIADPDFEAKVQSVARSHKLAFISSAQNLPLIQSAMGGDSVAEQHMLATFANFNTRLVLANSCSRTNSYFSDAWGSSRENFVTVSEAKPERKIDPMNMLFGIDEYTVSVSQQLTPRCPPDFFLALRRGGKSNKKIVDAFLTQGGRTFGKERSPFRLVSFKQR
ncbi:AAA-like domain protein [Roseimaritima multifibrata]|uniref:AAA-like domain protein n=1 Tax=Roseimaritima multifibrata TaxID=1930274 RepID=A0A517M972_9BACT|nr:TraM recognition domain-containing protein [Roseimaritima multifibrata]QDS91435.1 AAA-like domain protein [Roseimaritima multifibrata]